MCRSIGAVRFSCAASAAHFFIRRGKREMTQEQKPSGYPSIDKPWLKYYQQGAEEAATHLPEGKIVWDVIEERLRQYEDIPAIEYFGRVISRPEFIDMVYTWARAFKALGVEENEVVPYFGPFFPDVGAMAFALNLIGACPYFLKLAISPEALAEETKDARFAVVFDDMWAHVGSEFSKERFSRVIVVTAADAMPRPKKQLVSLLGALKGGRGTVKCPRGGKYLRLSEAKQYAKHFEGALRVPFVQDRNAFITSSSGTTVDGVVKGCVATNESTIAQQIMAAASEVQFFTGERCLNHFPPTASTALHVLFLLPLYMGMTVVMDPRVSEKDFYRQVVSSKASVIVSTGSAWEAFFRRFEKEIAAGKKFDFTCAKGWVVGGEGTDISKYRRWKQLLIQSGSPVGIASAFGLSELFSAVCTELPNARCDVNKHIIGVGIPYAGITVGVFDNDGKEKLYNQRGELWVKSQSAMKEYYNKPELTAQVKVDGWIHTGDLAEIDENGFVYIWGRINDTVTLPDGRKLYLFDIANKIKEKDYIDDALVLPLTAPGQERRLAAHIVWACKFSEAEKAARLNELNRMLLDYLPAGLNLYAYAEHDGMLPYSPTTLKKDKNRLSKQTEGFYQVRDGKLVTIRL